MKHIIKEGSREHVLRWDTYGEHCSETDCEINKKNEKADPIFKIITRDGKRWKK